MGGRDPSRDEVPPDVRARPAVLPAVLGRVPLLRLPQQRRDGRTSTVAQPARDDDLFATIATFAANPLYLDDEKPQNPRTASESSNVRTKPPKTGSYPIKKESTISTPTKSRDKKAMFAYAHPTPRRPRSTPAPAASSPDHALGRRPREPPGDVGQSRRRDARVHADVAAEEAQKLPQAMRRSSCRRWSTRR